MRNSGFTLLEMLISTAILSVVSILTIYALIGAADSTTLSTSKSEIQAGLRDTMTQVTSEVRSAYTQRLVDAEIAPVNTAAITVGSDGRSVTFQVPQPAANPSMVSASLPITIRLENEDTNGNGILDDGEDTNGDGVLTRRLVRIQGDQIIGLGAANTISDAQFSLLPNQNTRDNQLTTLRVRLTASKHWQQAGAERVVNAELESRVHLEN